VKASTKSAHFVINPGNWIEEILQTSLMRLGSYD